MDAQYHLGNVCGGPLVQRSRLRSRGIEIVKAFDASDICSILLGVIVHLPQGPAKKELAQSI